MGAVLLLTIENGLNLIDANPYSYPLVTASIIFIAVLVDSLRNQQLSSLARRKIRPEG
jgi:ribose transport system permease protein